MSLHLGNNVSLPIRHVVVILKLKPMPESLNTMVGQKSFKKERKIGPGPYRSVVLSTQGVFYYSPLDSSTLTRRLRSGK
jgi:hypothetical protein